jgi:hypothetical protein
MSTFWADKPVSVDGRRPVGQILSAEDLLTKITADISGSKMVLRPTVHMSADLDTGAQAVLLDFLNTNYVGSDRTKLMYSAALFSYYLADAIVIEFRPEKNDKLVGLIVGRRRLLNVASVEMGFLEVNFLCLIKPLRNLHLAPLMIAILTRECVNRYNISVATYTISAKIASKPFGKKQAFHRPLKLNRLVETGFFPDYYPQFEKCCKFNNKSVSVVRYFNGSTDYPEGLYDMVSKFNKKSYAIFDAKSEDELRAIFLNSAFHNFVFYTGDRVASYVCLYRLDTYNKIKMQAYKNGYVYISCVESDKRGIMDSVAEYCYKNDIFDVLTMTDDGSNADTLKFIEGTGYTNFYLFNMSVPPIENSKNGLVTI